MVSLVVLGVFTPSKALKGIPISSSSVQIRDVM